jgi:hypothetical protein
MPRKSYKPEEIVAKLRLQHAPLPTLVWDKKKWRWVRPQPSLARQADPTRVPPVTLVSSQLGPQAARQGIVVMVEVCKAWFLKAARADHI